MTLTTLNSSDRLAHLQAQAASQWVQVLQDPTPAQRSAFVEWLKESPRNIREFLFMLSLDSALQQLDVKRRVDINALLAQIDRQVVPFPTAAENNTDRPAWRRARFSAGLAASLVVSAVIGWMFFTQRATGWQELQTGISEQRSFNLQDGSVIQLNTRSRLAIHLAADRREVRLLAGEALFRVHHDAARPFRVYTHDAVIQDLGTQFNVYSRTDGTVVSVLEGQVQVTADAQRATTSDAPSANANVAMSTHAANVTVNANQQAQIDHAGMASVHTLKDVADTVAWQQRRLVFKQETLARIAEEFNRYNRQQIRVEGAEALAREYTGVFNVDDPDSLALILERDAGLLVEKNANGLVVKPRSPRDAAH